jgi:hypothetical protein
VTWSANWKKNVLTTKDNQLVRGSSSFSHDSFGPLFHWNGSNGKYKVLRAGTLTVILTVEEDDMIMVSVTVTIHRCCTTPHRTTPRRTTPHLTTQPTTHPYAITGLR